MKCKDDSCFCKWCGKSGRNHGSGRRHYRHGLRLHRQFRTLPASGGPFVQPRWRDGRTLPLMPILNKVCIYATYLVRLNAPTPICRA